MRRDLFALVLLAFACSETELRLDPFPAATSALSVTFSGTAPDAHRVRALGGLEPRDVVAVTGRFAIDVPLWRARTNEIEFVAEDALGERAASVRIAVSQTSPPESVLPADRLAPRPPVVDALARETTSPSVLLTGTAERGAKIDLSVGNVRATTSANSDTGRFVRAVPLSRGVDNQIVVTATDAAGNVSDGVVISVRHRQNVGTMSSALATPTLDAPVATSSSVGWTVRGATGPAMAVRVEGAVETTIATSDNLGRFTVGVELRRGVANQLTVVAVDDQGRSSAPAVATITHLASTRPATRFPIVLAHGFGGFRNIGPLDYYYDVPRTLREAGYEIHVSQVNPMNSILHRATELKAFIQSTTTGKVNIIAHSMGGLDGRAMISRLGMGDRVASLTTIGSPHYGTVLADIALGIVPGDMVAAADFLVRQFGFSLDAVREISVGYVTTTFNPATPNDTRVAYSSYGGVADPLGESGNILSPLFTIPWSMINARKGANDGLVDVESTKWGASHRVIQADHLDEIGQLAGSTDRFDHRRFFVELAESLQRQGF
ncbi:MAG: hypothetical protein HYY84_07940 [Deltaproteobacteria bacterium]|nr:hypothetical protein [Deltaproteobacteria bacterium]